MGGGHRSGAAERVAAALLLAFGPFGVQNGCGGALAYPPPVHGAAEAGGGTSMRTRGNMGKLRDGKINSARYNSACIKVVHVLKQGVSKQSQAGMSLGDQVWRDYRDDPDSIQVKWKVCAFRTLCVLGGLPSWRAVGRQKVNAVLWPAFLMTAVVNLVKTTGEPTITRRALWKLAACDWPIVRRQLRSLDPDVVVCGGTFDVLAHLWHGPAERQRELALGHGYWRGGKVLFVSAYHPAQRSVTFARDYETFRLTVERASSDPENTRWWRQLTRNNRVSLLG